MTESVPFRQYRYLF